MAFIKWLIDIFVVLFFQLFISHVAFGESNDVYYVAQFSDTITDCEDFENNMMVCENVEIAFLDGSDGEYGLFGQLNLKKEITDDLMINLMIYKDTPVGREFMYSIGGNICDSLKKDDTPWYPLVKIFNTTVCPITPRICNLDNLAISLAFAKDALRHELCGDYIIELQFQTELQEPLSCHIVPLELLEKNY